MNNIKAIQKLNEVEQRLGGKGSWHDQYKDSAYVFVGGLDYDMTEGDVISVFSQYGELVNINLVKDKATGKSKGFCFLAFRDQRSTVLTVDNLNGIKMCGRTIRVDHVKQYRRPKNEKGDEIVEQGCAPRTPSPSPSPPHESLKKKKKKKKEKSLKKKKNDDSTLPSSDSADEGKRVQHREDGMVSSGVSGNQSPIFKRQERSSFVGRDKERLPPFRGERRQSPDVRRDRDRSPIVERRADSRSSHPSRHSHSGYDSSHSRPSGGGPTLSRRDRDGSPRVQGREQSNSRSAPQRGECSADRQRSKNEPPRNSARYSDDEGMPGNRDEERRKYASSRR